MAERGVLTGNEGVLKRSMLMGEGGVCKQWGVIGIITRSNLRLNRK